MNTTSIQPAEIRRQSPTGLLQTILNNANSLVTVMEAIRGADGQIEDFLYVIANEKALTMIGLSETQVIDQRQSVLFPGFRPAGVFDELVSVVETGQPIRQERYYPAAGYEAWLDTNYIKHDDGVCVISYDLTAIRRAEQAQQQQISLMTGIVENGKAGITLFGPVTDEAGNIVDFQYIFTNAINSQNTGLPVADMTGKSLLTLFPDIAQTDWYARLLHTARTGERQSFLFHYRDSIRGWFDTLFVKLGDQVLFTDLNVTELKDSQLAQQQQAELLEQVMNTTPTAIVVHQSIRNEAGEIVDFRMTKVNQLAANMVQNTIENVQHRRISQYFPGLLDMPLFTTYKQVVQTGESARIDVLWGERWYDFSVARFGDGIVAAAQDITATRRYSQQIEQANLDLKRSNENLQSFAYVASHDLQEPLRKVISFASILNTQFAGQLNPTVADIIQRITTSTERMRLLIQDLLSFSQVDTKATVYKQVNLAAMLDELTENELWAAIQQSKAVLSIGALPTLLADVGQMRQLFQNLLSNAIKFCRASVVPAIRVDSRLVDKAAIPVTIAPTGKEVGNQFYEITVADNGIGFDEKYLDRIFQMFQRLHGRSTYAGSGVGLAICQKIVEKHGGAITATSQPGNGSTFRVYLPARN